MIKICCSTLIFIVLFSTISMAQEKCATVPYNEQLERMDPSSRSRQAFEKWMDAKIREKEQLPKLLRTNELDIYVIPVVVHIIHNGEPVGFGTNIPTEQIFSQIKVLNEDYRRNNFDTINTPEMFLPFAADTHIEFQLASRDPFGGQTEGIVRVRGTKSSWNSNSTVDDRELKSLSFWPPEDYLNIWVTDLSGSYLGYAQYPETDLPGSIPPFDRETDGVVIDYSVFGSIIDGSFPDLRLNYNRGRTTTHEVGHFFGLRHIWGDGGCGATDYVDDTPDQESSYNSCNGILGFSCGSDDMYQNYMDYTYDACMNLFTIDQTTRMRIVLENSPRRKSLLNSSGLLPPDFFPNILVIREIVQPENISCESEFSPVIQVQNTGINTINDFEVQLVLDEINYPIRKYEVEIQPGESDTFDLSSISGTEILDEGQHLIQVEILRPNGVENISYEGRIASQYFLVNTFEDLIPLREAVSSTEISDLEWGSFNPDNEIGWEVAAVPLPGKQNQAFRIELFNYTSDGEQDWLVSPLLDMSRSPTANMTFDLSYARYDTMSDLLEIKVSTDCGATFPFTVFRADSEEMAIEESPAFWQPDNTDDWKKYYVDLDDFAGRDRIRLAFVSTNGNGNNIYIDNIEFYETGFTKDLRLAENTMLVHPNPSDDGFIYVTVNMPERQMVDIRIVNMTGRVIMEKQLDAILNQTIEFDLNPFRNGMYLIQMEGRTFNKVQRIIIDR